LKEAKAGRKRKRDGSDIVKLGGPADFRAIFTRARSLSEKSLFVDVSPWKRKRDGSGSESGTSESGTGPILLKKRKRDVKLGGPADFRAIFTRARSLSEKSLFVDVSPW